MQPDLSPEVYRKREARKTLAILVSLLVSYLDLYWVGASIIGVISTPPPHPAWVAIPLWMVWTGFFVVLMLKPGYDLTLKGAVVVGLLWPLYPVFFAIWMVCHFVIPNQVHEWGRRIACQCKRFGFICVCSA